MRFLFPKKHKTLASSKLNLLWLADYGLGGLRIGRFTDLIMLQHGVDPKLESRVTDEKAY